MDIDFIFMVFWTAVADNMLLQCIALALLAKGTVAAYHKFVLEDVRWYIPMIPFSQYYLRWKLYYSSHIVLCIFTALFECTFFVIHSILFFAVYWILNCICLYQEDETIGVGNSKLYAFMPGYKFVMMGKESYNVRKETEQNFRATPESGQQNGVDD